MSKPNLEIKIGSMTMKNPVTVASGTFGYGPEYAELVDLNRLGATSEAADRHLLYADVDWGQEAETLCSVYKAANWHEREAYDMYGVRFAGHPELKRILLPDDVDYHALLKDFGRIEDAPEADPG